MTDTTTERTTDQADRAELQALLDGWAAAITANDADRIAAFIEPGWELVTPESGPVPLDGFLGAVRNGSLTHSEITFEVRSVRRHGDTAIVVAHGTNRGEWNGEPFSADEWVTELFVRRDDGWRCVLSALTPNQAMVGIALPADRAARDAHHRRTAAGWPRERTRRRP